ncbi:MAG: methyltransferase domain-containing protein [Planctomycetes bacterium]|nr:methyltransferase domain-containing protein [Planctomycetota bacterium]
MNRPDATVVHELLDASCVAALALRGSERVLDVGCGYGELAAAIAVHSARVLGIDCDGRIIATARATHRASNLEFRAGDALALPLRDDELGRFDLVHVRFVLESVRDQSALLAQAMRAVRPGGRVVLADDDHPSLRLWPEVPCFDSVWGAYLAAFDAAGNDSIAGRRLVALLHEAGAVDLRARVLSFAVASGEPAFRAAIARLRAILSEWRVPIFATRLVDAGELDSALTGLDAFAESPGAAIWYALCHAEGRR